MYTDPEGLAVQVCLFPGLTPVCVKGVVDAIAIGTSIALGVDINEPGIGLFKSFDSSGLAQVNRDVLQTGGINRVE